jgi:glycosyltransferase involved in cell wall biosynthesis
MHIWLVDQGEPLPFQQGMRMQRYGELTRYLAKRGHRVTWWATDFSHAPRGYVGEPNARVICDGVEVVLVHGSGYKKNISFARMKHVAVHARNLARLIVDDSCPDIVICGMPTIQSADVMVQYGKQRGVPVIVDIRDEWPEDYVRWLPKPLRPLGRLVLQPQFRALRRACGNASALCAVTKTQLAYGLRHAGREQRPDDAVFYTGARSTPLERSQVEAQKAKWRQSGLVEGDFICVFTGSMSPLRPLDATIAAVKRLSQRLPIKLVLAGNGDRQAAYRDLAADCPNVIFPGWIGTVEMAALNEIADVLLAPYKPNHGFSMPTKIFDYMAAGRPMLSSCPGEAEELIRREEIGIQIDEKDADCIEKALLELFEHPERRRRMGERARVLFEENFSLEKVHERYADHIERIATKHSRGDKVIERVTLR